MEDYDRVIEKIVDAEDANVERQERHIPGLSMIASSDYGHSQVTRLRKELHSLGNFLRFGPDSRIDSPLAQ